MKVVAAYLLADEVNHILGSGIYVVTQYERPALNKAYLFPEVGAEADGDNIELLLSQVKNRDITELIAAGREKLASVPSGGGGGVAVAASAAGGGGAAPAVAEAKKEEKAEEKEESDDDMGFGLFD